ncbi:MAG: molybdate ABC transporter substrate-binding protein [Candidatus Limnocylindrales bacterium]
MKSRLARRPAAVALAAVLAVTVSACSTAASVSPAPTSAAAASGLSMASAPPTAGLSGSLTIFGAASLKAVLAKAQAAFNGANPGLTITVSTDSSAALETQIEQGAPADVFLSADTTNPAKLVAKGLNAGGAVNVAGNLLTVIVPKANPAAIVSPSDLARPGVKVIAAGVSVPITKYATILVANLAAQAGYPADFVAKYNANVVSREDNVAAVVSKIELGEGDAGIVYVTDARTSTGVTTISVPADANVPATYAGVVVAASRNLPAASAFLAWFAGPTGQAILASYGFLPPS